MATTKKEGAPAKERATRSSLTPATMQHPRPRTTKPASPATSSSHKDPTSKPVPNYLKPTFSSSPDAGRHAKAATAGVTRAPQKGLPVKKGVDAKPQPQRSSSFNPPRLQAVKTALSSRSSFSDRTSKGKASASATHLSLKADCFQNAKPRRATRSMSSATSSVSGSTATSPKAPTEGTLSNEDKEAALDILNLDIEEHVLLEIPPAEEKELLDDPPPLAEDTEELTAFVEQEHVEDPVVQDVEIAEHEQHDSTAADDGQEEKNNEDAAEEDDHEEAPVVQVEEKEDAEEKPGEPDEKAMVEGSETDGEVVAAKVGGDEVGAEAGGVDGGGERVKLRVSGVEEEGAANGKRKEAAQQQQQGKKEAPPAYNDVIEETASKLVEKRKSKVKALVGAFETVIVLDSGGPAQ